MSGTPSREGTPERQTCTPDPPAPTPIASQHASPVSTRSEGVRTREEAQSQGQSSTGSDKTPPGKQRRRTSPMDTDEKKDAIPQLADRPPPPYVEDERAPALPPQLWTPLQHPNANPNQASSSTDAFSAHPSIKPDKGVAQNAPNVASMHEHQPTHGFTHSLGDAPTECGPTTIITHPVHPSARAPDAHFNEKKAAAWAFHSEQPQTQDNTNSPYDDCPAFTSHELTSRMLELTDKLCRLQLNNNEEIDALERRVGEQYGHWTDFINRTLDQLSDRLAIADAREQQLQQQYQEALQALQTQHQADMKKLELSLGTLSVQLTTVNNEMQLGLASAQSHSEGVGCAVRAIEHSIKDFERVMGDGLHAQHNRITILEGVGLASGSSNSELPSTIADLSRLQQDVDHVKHTMAVNNANLGAQLEGVSQRQVAFESTLTDRLYEMVGNLEKKVIGVIPPNHQIEIEELRHEMGVQQNVIRGINSQIQNLGTMASETSQHEILTRLTEQERQVARVQRTQNEIREALRGVTRFLEANPRLARKSRPRTAAPALPPPAEEVTSATSSHPLPTIPPPRCPRASSLTGDSTLVRGESRERRSTTSTRPPTTATSVRQETPPATLPAVPVNMLTEHIAREVQRAMDTSLGMHDPPVIPSEAPSATGSDTDMTRRSRTAGRRYRIEPPARHASGSMPPAPRELEGAPTRAIHMMRADPDDRPRSITSEIRPPATQADVAGLLTPSHAVHLLNSAKKPAPFSGKHGGDWQQFVREWKPYELILEKVYPKELWDTIKLETLKGLLDQATLNDFQAKFEADGRVSYADFWDEIDRKFGRDANHQNQQAWRRVRLNVAGKRMTSAEWRNFRTEFVLRRNRVADRTEAQEYELLMAQLSRFWGDEVAKAESKKNAGGHWVKVSNLPADMTRQELRELMEEWCESLRSIVKVENGYRVGLEEEDYRVRLLKYEATRWMASA